ncbi:GMP synthase (glutamine-hydrolysing) [Breoghania corrubedonensis]|uniref:GMP synthase (Glutamine-hydrolysing) n=1 Tax=Breoghania corrubedonensis TaxID=665038 RepID=A0A2T5UYK0_9HYPH|nr:type 1 glutamine amidotransferase [Breoghania corrubedonensis]PTW56572.1 GMP synthase (glutamine-hydrolysing) [Breoghania corrubedonensis]
MTKKTIGILQPGHAPDGTLRGMGDYDQCFRALLGETEFTYLSFDVEGGQLPDNVHAADGWLITGSRHGAYEDHPWRDPLEDFIRAAHEAGLPLVGICFGHQIIARALGGEVKLAETGWIAGPQTYRGPDGKNFTVNAWHRDQVTRVPEGLEVFASGENCPVAGMFEPGRVLTFQPHPEFDAVYTAALLEERGASLPEPLQSAVAQRLRDTPLDRSYIAQLMREFLKDPSFRL